MGGLPGWAQALILASSALLAWQTIWKRGLLPVYRIAKVIERIGEEFKPNGGNSMRDKLDRIEEKVDVIEGRWLARANFLDEIAAKIDDHLSHEQWWQERDRVVGLLERQALLTAAVFEVLTQDGSPLAQQIANVLRNAIQQTHPPEG
jgi:hypothetical protein